MNLSDLAAYNSSLYMSNGKMSPELEAGIRDLRKSFDKMVKDLAKDVQPADPVPSAEVSTSTTLDGVVMRFEVLLTGVALSQSPNMIRRGDKLLPASLKALGFASFKGDVDVARAARYLANEARPAVSWEQAEDRSRAILKITATAIFHHPSDKASAGL